MKTKTKSPSVVSTSPAAVVSGFTLGLDLGDRAHHVCVLDVSGQIVREACLPNTRPALSQLLTDFPRATVALEAGTHSPWISRYLTGLGAVVLVANPRKLHAISRNERKCDRRDAQMLARLARADVALLHPIEHGTALLPRSEAFKAMLDKAGIAKLDSQGRVVDFHSLRHTFCTNLHKAGVPQREAMELMRHNDPRLTASTYADASLFALRSAVEKLSWSGDAQRDAQRNGFEGHLPSLAGTVEDEMESGKSPVDMGLKSLSGTECHAVSKKAEWLQRQGSNLQHHG